MPVYYGGLEAGGTKLICALGTGPDGITGAELTRRILKEVTALTLKAIDKNMGDISKTANEALSKEATNALDKATKSVGDLLKKK